MKIFVMRHGQTVWNKKGITQGRSKNRLSKEGLLQAEESARILKYEKIDLIISSPIMRTVQTANIMNKYHNIKIIKDDKITEIDQGIFTGRKYASLTEEEKQIKAKTSKSAGMESFENVAKRVQDFVEEIKQKYNEKTLLIVTHNITASAIEAYIKNEKFDMQIFRNKINFKNAEVKSFEI